MRYIIFVLFSLLFSTAQSRDTVAREITPHDFAEYFIRALIEDDNSLTNAAKDIDNIVKDGNYTANVFSSVIRNGTRSKLKLGARIFELKKMKISRKDFSILIPYLASFYKRKYELYDELVISSQNLLAGRMSEEEYGKLVARAPQITAEIEFADESIFKMTPMVGLFLISNLSDKNGQLSRLSMTRLQGQRLKDYISSGFGEKLNKQEQNWAVASASVLQGMLNSKNYSYADDAED